MYFRHFGLQNTWLDNCVERCVSEDLLTYSIVYGLQQFYNLKDSAFAIFIDHYEGN